MMRWDFGREGIEYLHHHADGTNVVGLVLMIILWAAVITALVVGIRALILYGRYPRGSFPNGPAALPGRQPGAGESPLLNILQERYARGEIDRDEFLQRKQDLGLD